MDHLLHSKTSYGQAATEGSNWQEGQPKNAYARLVQQHHSGRFKLYLNYIAQKLQQEESVHADSVCDKDSAGAIKDGNEKNVIGASGLRPEKRSELGNTSKNRVAIVPKHQYGRDTNEDTDLGVRDMCKSHALQNSSNMRSSKCSHDYECSKESQHEKEVSVSHICAKSISRGQYFEGMVLVKDCCQKCLS